MAHALLHLIDEIVTADAAPPGFAGTICVGVGERGAMSWWRGRFGRAPEHGLVDEVDPKADAVFALAEETATDIVDSGVGDAQPAWVVGDTALLARFIQRYFENRSFLDARTGRSG